VNVDVLVTVTVNDYTVTSPSCEATITSAT
jgi:hypothetical protein